ncbi:MAG: GxxExxY protein [Gemmatimonas sp.]|nr:GxxExxY protein [Gemmatimonas sp.]
MERDLCDVIIGSAIEVHRALGPGLLENAYQRCLSIEMEQRRLRHDVEVAIPIVYKGCRIEPAYRADFVVEDEVIVEVKAVSRIEPIHKAQLLTYLKLTGIRTGLLLNFNSPTLRDGITRMRL